LCANAPWLPATMEAWFQRACAREPGNRFASAQEFAEALRAACDGTLRPPGLAGAMIQPGAPGDLGGRSPSVLTGSGAQAVSVGTDAAMSRSGQLVAGGSIPKGKGPLVALAIVVLAGGLAIAALLAFGRHGQVT